MKRKELEKPLQNRIRSGDVNRKDVNRRLAELAFGRANDCVRLVLEESPDLEALDLSLLREVKRNEKGTVEIRLVDLLEVLQQLEQSLRGDTGAAEAFLLSLQEAKGE